MKLFKPLVLGALVLPTFCTQGAVDLPTLALDAADNVFNGKNYSWTTLGTRPDGSSVTINGQVAGENATVSIQDGTTTRNLVIVSGVPYVLIDSGWQQAGPPRPPAGEPPPDDLPFPPPPDRERAGRLNRPWRFAPAGPLPDQQVMHVISEVSSWTADGDMLTGQFSTTLPEPGGGQRVPATADAANHQRPLPTVSGVLKLWIQGGFLRKTQITRTVVFTPPSGTAVTQQCDDITSFSAVGTTTVTFPAALKTLLSSSGH